MGRWTWGLVGCVIWTGVLWSEVSCRRKPAAEAEAAAEASGSDPGEESGPGTASSAPRQPPAAVEQARREAEEAQTPSQGVPGATTGREPAAEAPVPPPPATPPAPRPPLPDPRILLTQKDVESLLGTKVSFVRSALPGVPTDEDRDAILYLPSKGNSFGAAVQVFRGRTPEEARDRYTSLLASYPSAQEIQPVAGRTFFSYWEEVLHIGFLVPARNLVVVASCGRSFCDSDGLYEVARRMAGRIGG